MFRKRVAALSKLRKSAGAPCYRSRCSAASRYSAQSALCERGIKHTTTQTTIQKSVVPDRIANYVPSEHPDFEVVRSDVVAEHNSVATLYRHKATGAELVSVVCDEAEKVFGCAFKTPVTNDSGVPHILEHSVLCGSRLFPSKEPFVELLKSSLQTFLNAYTYPDRTLYPVASPNLQDFYNLTRVYLDAVLYPKLEPWVLAQEGWHIEIEQPAEYSESGLVSPPVLSYKGVVYNEMKGVYSQGDSLHAMATEAALFPDTPYSRSSGGDPLAIPSLTYPAFKAYHETQYSPENARFWFYGDDSESARLEILAEYLTPLVGQAARKREAKLSVRSPGHWISKSSQYHNDSLHTVLKDGTPNPNPIQQPFSAPIYVSLSYPVAPDVEEFGGQEEEQPTVDASMLSQEDFPNDPTVAAGMLPAFQTQFKESFDECATRSAPVPKGSWPRIPSNGSGKPSNDDHYCTMAWCLGEAGGDQEYLKGTLTTPRNVGTKHVSSKTRFGLSILSHLLMGTQTATLRKALNDSHFGTSITGGGMDDGALQPTFAAGLKGVKAEDVQKVEELILKTLQDCYEKGFESDHVEATLNTFEFSLREFSEGGGPRGLSLFLGAANGWVHGRDPLKELCYEEILESVKSEIHSNPRYLPSLIKEYLLDNTHRATVHMYPDAQWNEKRDALENARLAAMASEMTREDIERLEQEVAELQLRQETPDSAEAIAAIPSLSLDDLPKTQPLLQRQIKPIAVSSLAHAAVTNADQNSTLLLSHDHSTGGIAYGGVIVDASEIPTHLLPLLPLYAWCTTSCGTEQTDEITLARLLGIHTGGVSCSATVSDVSGHPQLAVPQIRFFGKALRGKCDKMSELMVEMFNTARLDRKDRVITYLKNRIASHESGIVGRGNGYASGLLAASYSKPGWISEIWGGVTNLKNSRLLLDRIQTGRDGGFDKIVDDLKELRRCLQKAAARKNTGSDTQYPGVIVYATSDSATLGELETSMEHLTGSIAIGGSEASNSFLGKNLHWPVEVPTNRKAGDLHLWPHATTEEEAAMDEMCQRDTNGNSNVLTFAHPGADIDFSLSVPSQVNYTIRASKVNDKFSSRLKECNEDFKTTHPSQVRISKSLNSGDPASRVLLDGVGPQVPASTEVISNMLSVGHLWDKVRVQGGAYGVGCSVGRSSGILSFYSYRDPSLVKTLSTFDGVGQYLGSRLKNDTASGHGSLKDDLRKAIISTIGSLDSPLSPAEKGGVSLSNFLSGVTPAAIQARRDSILNTNEKDVQAYVDALNQVETRGQTAFVGSSASVSEYSGTAYRKKPLLVLHPLAKK